MKIIRKLQSQAATRTILLFAYLAVIGFLLSTGGSHVFAEDITAEKKESFTFFVDSGKVRQLQDQFGTENVDYIPEISLANLTIDKEREGELQAYNIDYTTLPEIDLETVSSNVTKESTYSFLTSPNYSKFNWGYSRVMQPLGSHKSNGGEGVTIAVIDSGIDLTHPELQDNQLTQINYSNSKNNEDEYGHGTQIAGVIDTLAPNAKLYSYKVMDSQEGESFNIIRAIIDASIKNVDIINISLSTEKDPATLEFLTIKAFQYAVAYAKQRGTFVVGSAGNNSENLDEQRNKLHLPGGLDQVITVGATIKDGSMANYSNYGSKVDIYGPVGWFGESYAADGVMDAREMLITYYPMTKTSPFEDPDAIPKGTTLSFGTSLATPEVTSALATIISRYRSQGIPYHYDSVEKELMENSQQGNAVREVRIRD